MVALFLDDNKTNDDGDDKRRTARDNMFILTNNNFAPASRYFVHFLAAVALYNMKLPG